MTELKTSSSIQTEAFGAVSTADRRVSAHGNHRAQKNYAERMKKPRVFGGPLSPGAGILFPVSQPSTEHATMFTATQQQSGII